MIIKARIDNIHGLLTLTTTELKSWHWIIPFVLWNRTQLFSPFYRWGNWSSESLRNLTKVMWSVEDRVWTLTLKGWWLLVKQSRRAASSWRTLISPESLYMILLEGRTSALPLLTPWKKTYLLMTTDVSNLPICIVLLQLSMASDSFLTQVFLAATSNWPELAWGDPWSKGFAWVPIDMSQRRLSRESRQAELAVGVWMLETFQVKSLGRTGGIGEARVGSNRPIRGKDVENRQPALFLGKPADMIT